MIGIDGLRAVLICWWWPLFHLGSPHLMFYNFPDIDSCWEHLAQISAPVGAVDFQATCVPSNDDHD